LVDAAIEMQGVMNGYLQQRVEEQTTLEAAVAALEQLEQQATARLAAARTNAPTPKRAPNG